MSDANHNHRTGARRKTLRKVAGEAGAAAVGLPVFVAPDESITACPA
jgi:hypothetical protein